ncbi:transposase [Gluconacetobacter sacchari]|uniref:transposase n=1 Tax=Gluconacetobacter sacchari TaxID=92759 RepID=UPI003570A919
MPDDLPPWSAVYQQSRRRIEAGCFEALASDLRAVLRMASGRKAEPTAAILDSRTLRSMPQSGMPQARQGLRALCFNTRKSSCHHFRMF